MSLLHRRVHDRESAERRRPRADDRGGACGVCNPRGCIAGSWNADEGARRKGGDVTITLPASTLSSRRAPLADPREQLARLDASTAGRARFSEKLPTAGRPDLRAANLEIFQINLGKLCNMTCRHCHVDAGPDRSDAMMTRSTVDACLRALDKTSAHTVDITGGAPELHPEFRYLVEAAHARGKHVIDRCNLSVLLLQRNAGLAEWLADRDVEIVASLPHYRQRNTDAQRGDR